jgi:hypothetical protein
MSDPDVHIAEWQAAGLIDSALAQTLRNAAGDRRAPAALVGPGSPGSIGSFFGPTPTIGEVFAYLGAGFLLGAWIFFLGSVLSAGSDREAVVAGGLGLATLVMAGLGFYLAKREDDRRRAAGVAFVVATVLAAGAAAFVGQLDFLRNALQGAAPGVMIALVAVVTATVFERYLPAVTTQFGVLVAATALAGTMLQWLQAFVVPVDLGGGACCATQGSPTTPVWLVVVAAGWWLLVALAFGILALRESRHAGDDPAAARRVSVTQFWAGFVAVVGLASALTQSGPDSNGNYGRILEPVIADVAILLLSIVLLERAFRRESSAYIFAGAIGLIVALTDFNVSYLAQSTYVGLLIEGVILLAVAFSADRLRRRLGRQGQELAADGGR